MKYRLKPKYGRLTTKSEYSKKEGGKTRRIVKCICDCGSELEVCIYNLKSGNTKSCGCYRKEITSKNKTTHGMSGTNIYDVWCKMIDRCHNENNKDYKFYGKKGIIVCTSWREDFGSFYNEMGEPPSKKHSLERIDSTKNYDFENCKWATKKQQARNQSNNKKVTYKGEVMILIELCEKYNLNYTLVADRLRNGWDIDSAIKAPKHTKLKSFKKS